jgi:hypothetical protein
MLLSVAKSTGKRTHMRTEAQKRYYSGFNVSEQELRRLVDTVSTQFTKPPCTGASHLRVMVKFKNGATSEATSLDDLFRLENAGSEAVERVGLHFCDKPEDARYTVDLILARAGFDDEDEPLKYSITGDDRDWVFVTSSLLEERIGRVRRMGWHNALWSRRVFPFLVMAVFFISMLFGMTSISSLGERRGHVVDSLESQWKQGTLQDPILFMLRLERARSSDEEKLTVRRILVYPWLVTSGAVLIFYLIGRARPAHTFYWGDAAARYDRRMKVLYFVVVVIILGTVLSVFGSFIASKLHL